VDQIPTPNPIDIAKLIPPQPDLEFEVATIKPAASDERKWQIQPLGSQIIQPDPGDDLTRRKPDQVREELGRLPEPH
jgi:hypothetical protein